MAVKREKTVQPFTLIKESVPVLKILFKKNCIREEKLLHFRYGTLLKKYDT